MAETIMAARQDVHPLFDPLSDYRAMTQASVWGRDGGAGSVRRFFLELLRQSYLDRKPMPEPTPEVEAAFPKGVYRLHYERRKGRVIVPAAEGTPALIGEPERAMAAAGMAGAAMDAGGMGMLQGAGPAPVTWCYDAGDVRKIVAATDRMYSASDKYTGDGEIERNAPDAGSQVFEYVKQTHPRRRCVALLLADELVQEIAKVMPGRSGRVLPDEVEEFLLAVLRAMRPSDDEGTEGAGTVAYQLAVLLSLAPGLEGVSNDTGLFRAKADFAHRCPLLPTRYLWFFCAGPEMGG